MRRKGMVSAMYKLSKSVDNLAKLQVGSEQQKKKATYDTEKAVKRILKTKMK